MMTASRAAADDALDSVDVDVDALARPLTLDTAYAQAHRAALSESVIGSVGLEIETHLVDLHSVADAVEWQRLDPMPDTVRAAAGDSAVTLEPGGQLELSGPPVPDVMTAVTGLRQDMQRARMALAEVALGAVHLGADPLRPPRRINPRPRYRAMERHYAATGRGAAAAVMMNSTAAMQVNLDAGPAPGWCERVARAHSLGPTMMAISACSPWLQGRDTGWKSARQRAWRGLDPRTSGAVPGVEQDPTAAWARYALHAPVAFVRSESDGDANATVGVEAGVPFEVWASGSVQLGGRLPTAVDLRLHLTTLFPPVRLRGYLELRYLDMTAPRWWPAIAAVVTTLMDDPTAADLASDATQRSAQLWTEAARDGLGNAVLADSARRCLAIAADRVPAGLTAAVADLAELVESGRCPGDLLTLRIAEIGPRAAFEELAHA
jgi:glutamate--cysteine ligase